MVKQTPWRCVPLLFVVLLVFAGCAEIADSRNPPAAFRESDLVGTWAADYGRYEGDDQLILRADGTFKQTYGNEKEDYLFETPWNEWRGERFADGRVRVHLRGARYYFGGIREAEEEGVRPTLVVTGGDPRLYHDPFDPERRFKSVRMVRELVLNVRLLPSGELVLAHMWPSSEYGFGDSQVLHRVGASSAQQTPAS